MNACRAGVLVFGLVLVLSCTSAFAESLTVRQQNDGNVVGRVELTDVTRTAAQPIRAEVYFLQDGKLLGRYLSNEWGHFQVPGLEPGEYSVIAKADDVRIGFYTVEVFPYIKEPVELPAEILPISPVSFQDVEVVPVPDVLVLQIVDSTLEPVDQPVPTSDPIIPPPSQTGVNVPMNGAPRGGGAGGLGAALGIAGVVLGSVALGTDDEPASPPAP
jgi:hypothetical protein